MANTKITSKSVKQRDKYREMASNQSSTQSNSLRDWASQNVSPVNPSVSNWASTNVPKVGSQAYLDLTKPSPQAKAYAAGKKAQQYNNDLANVFMLDGPRALKQKYDDGTPEGQAKLVERLKEELRKAEEERQNTVSDRYYDLDAVAEAENNLKAAQDALKNAQDNQKTTPISEMTNEQLTQRIAQLSGEVKQNTRNTFNFSGKAPDLSQRSAKRGELDDAKKEQYFRTQRSRYGNLPEDYKNYTDDNSNGDSVTSMVVNGRLKYDDSWSDTDADYAEKMQAWDIAPYMTDDEIARYNYIRKNMGEQQAKDYLYNYAIYDINKRKQEEVAQNAQSRAEEHPFWSSVESVGTNVFSGLGGLNIAAQGIRNKLSSDYRPIDWNRNTMTASNYTEGVRDTVTNSINSQIGQFLYGTAMSMADSGVSMALASVGVPGTTWILGGAAASSAMKEAKDRGASDEQAIGFGLLSGIAEALFEEVSLEKFIQAGTGRGAKEIIMNILKQSFTEGSEEVFTTIANTISDALVLGDKSDYNTKLNQYISQGYERGAAERMAANEWFNSLLLDFAGGALSGGVFGGIGQARTNFQFNSAIKGINSAETFRDAYSAWASERANLDAGARSDKASLELNNAFNTKTYKNADQTALAKIFSADTIREVQDARLSAYDGTASSAEGLSDVENYAFYKSMQLAQNETNNQATQNTAEEQTVPSKQTEVDRIMANGIMSNSNADAIAADKDMLAEFEQKTGQTVTGTTKSEIRKSIKSAMANYMSAQEQTSQNAILDDEHATQQASESTTAQGNVNTQENVNAENATKQQRKQAMIRQQNVSTINMYANSSVLGNSKEAFITNYNSDVDPNAYFEEFMRYKNLGLSSKQTGKTFAQILEQYGQSDSVLTPKAVQAAFQEGQNQSVRDDVNYKAKKNYVSNAEGYFQGSNVEEAKVVGTATANKTKLGIMVTDLTKVAKNGQYTASVASMALNGGENARVLFSFGHEGSHHLEAYNNADWQELRNSVLEFMAAKGGYTDADGVYHTINESYSQYKEAYKGNGAETKTAIENEMVSDFFGQLFDSEDGVDDYVSWLNNDSGYTEEQKTGIKAKLTELLDRIVAFLKRLVSGKDVELNPAEHLAAQASLEEAQRFRKAWLAAMDKAAANVQNGEYAVAETVSTEVQNSIQLDQKMQTSFESAYMKLYGDNASVSNLLETVRKDREDLAKFLTENRDKLKLPEDKAGKTIFKNQSYSVSVENTTVCIRSLMQDRVCSYIEKAIGRKLTIAEAMLATQRIAELTGEPQCAYCYVAADRMQFDQKLGEFLNDREKIFNGYKAGESFEEAYKDMLAGRTNTDATKKRATFWWNLAEKGKFDGGLTNKDLAGIYLDNKVIAEKQKTFSGTALEEYKMAISYAKSASHGKLRTQYAAYKGDLLNTKVLPESLVKTLNAEFGLRFYSYSDYSPAFILENMQMICDASARGLKGLMYTKELDLVRIFAKTGANINVSTFCTGKGNNIGMDAMQGADWEQAKALRAKSKNVGITMVCTNDDQVRWAMEQDWIDVVLPYHSVFSGGGTVAKMNGYTDYKGQQEDKVNKDLRKLLKANGKVDFAKQVYPTVHDNDLIKYVNACREEGLTPRFAKFMEGYNAWLTDEITDDEFRSRNVGYMKLVKECRQSASETQELKPVFDMEAAYKSLNEMIAKGGYDAFLNQDIETENAFADMIANEIEPSYKPEWVNAYGETQNSIQVSDKTTLDSLNKQIEEGKYFTVYRSFQVIDGELYAPMNAVDRDENGKNKRLGYRSQIGVWEQATESPEIAQRYMDNHPDAKYAKFDLDGIDNKTGGVAYNPYLHASNLALNDQFSAAYRRNLVTVECRVPMSELGAYKAQYAKDGTGWADWKAGKVAGKLAKVKPNMARKLFVSRYMLPYRILSNAEVASLYKEYLDGTNISVPWNVVTPGLRNELEAAGVPIDYSDVKQGNGYLKFSEAFKGETQYSISINLKDELKSVVDGSFDSSNNEVYIGESSNFLTNVIGAKSFSNTMPASKAYANMVSKETAERQKFYKYNDDTNFHNLGVDGLYDLLEASEEPTYAFVDTSAEDGRNRNNRIALVTDREIQYLENGKENTGIGVVYMELDSSGRLSGKRIPVNKTITAFPKAKIDLAIKEAVAENRILAIKNTRSNAVRPGANPPGGRLTYSVYEDNINQFWYGVNSRKGKTEKMSATVETPTAMEIAIRKAMEDSSGTQNSIQINDNDGKFLTRSQREFFKDSKARDEDGYLETVYHGSRNDFNVFDINRAGEANGLTERAMFFSNRKNVANQFAEIGKGSGNANVRDFYLNITNPFDLANLTDEQIDQVIEMGMEKLNLKDSTVRNSVNELLEAGNYYGLKMYLDYEQIQSMGYDGVIARFKSDYQIANGADAEMKEYAVFSPDQIKLRSNGNPTANDDIRYSVKVNTSSYTAEEIANLEARAKGLEQKLKRSNERKEYYKNQMKLTPMFSPDAKGIKSIVNDYFGSDYVGSMDAESAGKKLSRIYTLANQAAEYEKQGKREQASKATQQAQKLAEELATEKVDNTLAMEGWSRDLYDRFKKDAKRKMYMPEEYKGDFAGEYNEFRKRNMGRFTLTNNPNDAGIDTVYDDLWENGYSGLLKNDQGERETHPAEQIKIIANAFATFAESYDNPFNAYDREEVIAAESESLIGRVLETKIAKSTSADVWKEKVKAAEEKVKQSEEQRKNDVKIALAAGEQWGKNQAQKTIDKQTEQIAKLNQTLTEVRKKRDEKLKKIRADRDAKLKAQKEYYRGEISDYKEKVARREAYAMVKKHTEQLRKKVMDNNVKTGNYVHADVRAAVAEFVAGIDMFSENFLSGKQWRYADKAEYTKWDKLQDIAEQSARAMNGLDTDYFIDLPAEFYDDLRQLKDAISMYAETFTDYYHTQTLDSETLLRLDRVLTILNNSISNVNKLYENAVFSSAREAGANTIRDIRGINMKAERGVGKAANAIFWDSATPYYAFQRYGSGGKSIMTELTKGWSKFATNIDRVMEFQKTAYDIKEQTAWSQQVIPVDTDHGEINMTASQLMSLWCLSQRKTAQKHMRDGGLRVGEYKDGKRTVSSTDVFKMSDEQLGNAFAKLSDEQREVAKKLRDFMNTVCTDWGNEISMARFGILGFGEENYFPMKVDPNSRHDGKLNENASQSLYALVNMGFTKALDERASNPLIVSDIFSVFSDHAANMAKYNALALPLLDAMKWYNFAETAEDGSRTGASVTKSLEEAYGAKAKQYFKQFMADMNAGDEGGNTGSPTSMLMSGYKAASVGANLRVAFLQPTSIFRAMAELDPKYVAKGTFTKGGIKEAHEYSGIMKWKDLGFYDTDIGRSVRYQLMGETNKRKAVMNTITDKSMAMAEFGDRITWGALWNAVKEEVSDKYHLEGNALLERTAERFDELMLKTQVFDSTISRSAFMRRKDGLAKMEFAFQAEPTLALSMLMDRYYQLRADIQQQGKDKAWANNKGKIGRVLTAYAVTNAFAALIEALFDSLRWDGDEEKFIDKFLQNFGWNVSVTNKMPLFKDLYSIFQGYSSERMDTAVFQSAYKSFNIWKERIAVASGKQESFTSVTNYGNMTDWGAIYKTLQFLSQASGLPVYNTSREVTSIWNGIAEITGWHKILTYDSSRAKRIKTNATVDSLVETGELTGDSEKIKEDISGTSLSKDVVRGYLTKDVNGTTLYKAGIPIQEFESIRNVIKQNGYTKKEDKMTVIDAANLTDAQKDALYYYYGWAKSTIGEAPWHQ